MQHPASQWMKTRFDNKMTMLILIIIIVVILQSRRRISIINGLNTIRYVTTDCGAADYIRGPHGYTNTTEETVRAVLGAGVDTGGWVGEWVGE